MILIKTKNLAGAFDCECAIYKLTNLIRAQNYNENFQSVPLSTANNVSFFRYILFLFFRLLLIKQIMVEVF